ncbi:MULTISPECIES: efflux RND transporter periplasmic adaptor subunit [Geobacter]|uniref:efflux RND transporter periplasmic adaptor subunit n=1 Tax=Geobacter TaxID=28231 RepID=UPI00257230A6|nr:efflux RND transporter periplasmic adaptor subunit [Geobacter sulfurreducens]BEH11168.1 efflux RND transporter periplasmic adaptor subunit [Geobacter sulfurreducens subsp. ethanolicus]BET59017.1 efflux RND transporter periplasmic adaptor subunit [Geobacter sp. 60473]
MNRKHGIIIGLVLAMAIGGGIAYRSAHVPEGAGEHAESKESGHAEGKGGHDEGKEHAGEKEGHGGHGEEGAVSMTVEAQKQNGVIVVAAAAQRLAGVISATGKVEANADRTAHVSPRISGKIVSVRASLGDSVAAGQPLVTLDSVELGEALNRYHQSKTRLALAQSSMDRIKALVEKKIAARKDILQAETDYKMAQTELHTDEERLALYGVSASDLTSAGHRKPLLPVRSPIGGVITEKHAIVGELADPSKSLFTVADLSSVWVMVDINEKDLAKVHRGQSAIVTLGAFPDVKLKGRITYIADLVDVGSRTVKARVEVLNPARKLKPEMFATVELTLAADAPPVLAVPEDALQDLDGKKVVFVAEKESEFAARPVQTGRAAGGLVEIVSGLKEGERYAVKGSFILKSELKKGEMTDEHGHGE